MCNRCKGNQNERFYKRNGLLRDVSLREGGVVVLFGGGHMLFALYGLLISASAVLRGYLFAVRLIVVFLFLFLFAGVSIVKCQIKMQ